MIVVVVGVIAAVASAVTPVLTSTMAWTGKAAVYFDGKTIPIRVRTTLAPDGTANSESWPEELDEIRGLRRMIVRSSDGETQVGGKVRPLPLEQFLEERAQFGIYRQIQEAYSLLAQTTAAGADTASVTGMTRSWFVYRDGEIVRATNWLPVGPAGSMVRQDFIFDGWYKVGSVRFPRHMILNRDGKPYFELWTDSFDVR